MPAHPNSGMLTAERRQVSVLFADVVGSTALSMEMDPEDLMILLGSYHGVCSDVIGRFKGTVVDFQGDGVMAVFGYPVAREDEPLQAVRAGLALISAVLESLPGIRLRVGIHTGMAVVGHLDGPDERALQVVGDTTNIAARIQGEAEPGTLVISGDTHRLVEGWIEGEWLGRRGLKGIAVPLDVHRVDATDTWPSRLDAIEGADRYTPMVGRRREMEFLRDRWELACRGSGSMVLIHGVPGIGKSRLVDALLREVGSAERVLTLRARCSPYLSNTPLSPMIEMLEASVLSGVGPESRGARLRRFLSVGRAPVEETFSLFGPLLDIEDPGVETRRHLSAEDDLNRLLDACVQLLLDQAALRPVLCVVEDIHWADQASLDLLRRYLGHVSPTSILMVVTARPAFEPGWGSHTHLDELELLALEGSEAASILRFTSGSTHIEDETVAVVLARAAGVPLYVEELTRWVVESEGRPGQPIPPTLRDLLMSRLDQLGPTKRVAQLASVVAVNGEFRLHELVRLSPLGSDAVGEALRELMRADVLYRRTTTGDDTSVYGFKHALVSDAAYESLLRRERVMLHRRIAEILEAGDEFVRPELLAHHRMSAGDVSEAIVHLGTAAEMAIRRGSFADAAAHLRTALALPREVVVGADADEGDVKLLLLLGEAVSATEGYASEEAEDAFLRAIDRTSNVEAFREYRLRAMYNLSSTYMSRGDQHRGLPLSEQLIAEADESGDPRLRTHARNSHATALLLSGRPLEARARYEEALELHRPHGSGPNLMWADDGEATNTCMLALTLAWLGDHAASNTMRQRASLAAESAHPLSRALTLGASGCIDMIRGDIGRMGETAAAFEMLVTEYDMAWWRVWADVFRSWHLARFGDLGQGVRDLEDAIDTGTFALTGSMRPYFSAELAALMFDTGRIDDASRLLTETFDLVERTGEQMALAELWRVRGIVDANVADLRTAIEIAGRQGARTLELRAAVDLGRLLANRGDDGSLDRLLEPLVQSFDGFEWPVLIDARAMIH